MICLHCNLEVEISDEIYECPECEAVLKAAPARKTKPTREVVATVESSNYNGSYQLTRLPDGSYSCNCLSFLYQTGTRNGETPFMTCKHIRSEMGRNNDNGSDFKFTPPSEWQKTCLKKLGVRIDEHLTNAQAYFILNDQLQRQGLEYSELKKLLLEHPKPEFLPLTHFGVEFEGGLGCSKEEFKNKMQDNGLKALITGYDHTLHNEKWKIASDSSVSISNLTPVEIVSPKLSGTVGFAELEKVLKLWNETLPLRNGSKVWGVNQTCGTHVHIDAKYGWGEQDLLRLAKVWAKIEVPVIWFFVSPSRRNGRYCMTLNPDYFLLLSQGRIPNRYHSLNLDSYQRQGSIEFRIHNGTLEAKKIIPWIIFCLKLVDAVKRGLSHRDFEPTFDGVMNAIGMTDSATPLIRGARSFLKERFEYWKEEAERNRRSLPEPFDVDNIEADIERRRREASRIRGAYHYRGGLTSRDESLPTNSVNNLASIRPSSIVAQSAYYTVTEGREWLVPSRTGNGSYSVFLNPTNDTLTCNCRGFRTHGHCYHSINLARHIYTQRELARVEADRGGDNNV